MFCFDPQISQLTVWHVLAPQLEPSGTPGHPTNEGCELDPPAAMKSLVGVSGGLPDEKTAIQHYG